MIVLLAHAKGPYPSTDVVGPFDNPGDAWAYARRLKSAPRLAGYEITYEVAPVLPPAPPDA
jgi:hypothetical protein